MTKAFNKGDLVTYISSWDNKGTVVYRQAVVVSCGKKQMTLQTENGVMMGRNYHPVAGTTEGLGGTFPRMEGEELERVALQIAANIVASETKHFETCLAAGHGEGYDAAIRKQMNELHEPQVMAYPY